MDEHEFRRLLDLFPVVRSRDFVVKEWHDAWEQGDNKQVEVEGLDECDAFWTKLKKSAERKVGAAEADRFCKTFQRIHNKLIHEELSSDAARNLLKLSLDSHK